MQSSQPEVSIVQQVINLPAGSTFSRSVFIPGSVFNPEFMKHARKAMSSYLTPVVARAKMEKDRNYKVYTTTSFTRGYDVIVTGIIVVEDEEDEV